jgi:hypothetical protein
MLSWKPNNSANSNAEKNNPSPLLSKAYLTTLNLDHFKMAEARGLKIIVLRSPRMASSAYHIS